MAIVTLKKITLYGLASERQNILLALQQLGCVHLIDLSGDKSNKAVATAERHAAMEAVRYLLASPIQNSNQYQRYTEGHDCHVVAQQSLANRDRRDSLSDERDFLLRSIEQLRPWGNFELPSEEQLGGLQLWFYEVPRREAGILANEKHAWQLVNSDRQNEYVVVVSSEEPESFPGNLVTLDRRPLSELEQRLEQVDEELESLHWQRVALTRWLTLLQRDLNEADDALAREDAMRRLFQDRALFVLQGWTAKSTLPAVEAFVRKHGMALSSADPVDGELPPTLLRNPTAVAGAEGVMTFYMTPSYKAWDPTWVLYLSFAVFFAIIMSDAAYGMLMGVGLLLFWRRLSGTESARRSRNLFAAIVVATIIYGVAAGSYFGYTPPGLDRFQLKLDGKPLVNNRDAMMILSLTIGVLHLTLANLINAWQNRSRSQALSFIGWAIVLVCGLVFGLTRSGSNRVVGWFAEGLGRSAVELQQLISENAKWGLIGGFGLVFLFSSSRPLFSTRPSDWLWRIIDGLMGLTNVSKAFGDTLSYLRLFALGLASAQLAVTFNDLAAGSMAVPGLGFLLAIVILVVGHSVNLMLGIMSGVVHGLRLNCIEFFNWSLTEEGYPFKAFTKKAG